MALSSSSNEKSMLLIDNKNKKCFSEIRTHEKKAKNPGLLTAPLSLEIYMRERKK